MKYVGISLNLDSLGEAYGFPKHFIDDKAFSIGLERIQKLSSKYKFPLTIFVVGRDLENKKNYYLLKKFCENYNIEIANHSYNHLFEFGKLDEASIISEIHKSHEIIYNCTKQEPKGFISPNWSISKNVIKHLIKLNYEYDTSFYPSIFLYPMLLKIFFNHKKNLKKAIGVLNRKDYLVPFYTKLRPFFLDEKMNIVKNNKSSKSILEFTMPTLNRFDVPIWHTVGYVFGWKYLEKKLKKFMKKQLPFFYLIHPADFLGKEDLDTRFSHSLYRMDLSYEEKISFLEKIFDLISQHNFSGKKIKEISSLFKDS